MPYTTLRNGGTAVVGDTTTGLIPQGLHPSAAAYLAALVSSSYAPSRTEIDAVNNLVLGLVANGIYSKIKALYPIIGGTAATHKWNLINPVDSDPAFRLTFLGGGWTHTSGGIKGNGTSSYANTSFIPSAQITFPSVHVSIYSRVQLQEAADVALGCTSASAVNAMNIAFGRTANTTAFGFPSGAPNSASATGQTSTLGFFCGTRTSTAASDLKITRNGVVLAVATANSATATSPTVSAYIGASNGSGVAANFCAKTFAFASIGSGLTDLEVRIFATLVQAYQTSLGRQV